MLQEIAVSFAAPLGSGLVVLIVGYYVFRKDQENKNEAIKTKFGNIAKDIVKNDERIREDFNEKKERDERMFERIETDLISIKNTQTQDGHDMSATKVAIIHLEKSVNNVGDKLDILIQQLVNRTRSDDK